MRLAIMARPRAGDWLSDEISAWRAKRIDIVVCLLEPEEILDLGLDKEAALCRAAGIDFISFPIPDRGVPASLLATVKLAKQLNARMEAGKAIAVHCRAGIGRWALIATCILVVGGVASTMIFEIIGVARGQTAPDTDEQVRWLHRFRGTQNAAI